MLLIRVFFVSVVCLVCNAWRRTDSSKWLNAERSKETRSAGSFSDVAIISPSSGSSRYKGILTKLLFQLHPAVAFRTSGSSAASSSRLVGKGHPRIRRARHHPQLSASTDQPQETDSRFSADSVFSEVGADDLNMSLGNHIEEFRERLFFGAAVVVLLILVSFGFSKDIVDVMKSPIAAEGVKFIQSNPSEFFFTTIKASGYSGLLLGIPVILNQIIAYVVPGLKESEKKLFGPLVLGSTILFYVGLSFGFGVLGPAALKFFLGFADGTVESFFNIDQYFDFLGFMMLSTGVAFQVPIVQTILAKLGVVNSQQMFSAWRYVVVGAIILAGFLTPSTDPLTQCLLAVPLIALYLGGASFVRLSEGPDKLEAQ